MAVRTGMEYLVDKLSGLTNSGEEFTDDQLQNALDDNRLFFQYVALYPSPTRITGGNLIYTDYYLPDTIGQYFELPTDDIPNDFFYLTDTTYFPITFGDGDNQAVYTQSQGLIRFNADTTGRSYYLSAFSYDLNGAAADIWNLKVSARENYIDIKTDNHTLGLEGTYQHCLERYRYFSSRSFKSNSIKFVRVDQGAGHGYAYKH